MNILRTLWQAQLASMRNITRHDSRMRLAFIVVILFDIAIGTWSGTQLIAHIRQWQAVGARFIAPALWSICLLTWSGMVGVVILEVLQQGLSDDISHLLFTLPNCASYPLSRPIRHVFSAQAMELAASRNRHHRCGVSGHPGLATGPLLAVTPTTWYRLCRVLDTGNGDADYSLYTAA